MRVNHWVSAITVVWALGVVVLGCSESDGSQSAETTQDVAVADDSNTNNNDTSTEDTKGQEPEVGEPSGQCAAAADGVACDDNNACTTNDVCMDHVCSGSVSLVCDDEGPCKTGTCDPEKGCQYTTLEDGAQCTVACFGEAYCKAGDCQPNADSATQCPKPTTPCVDQLQCDPDTGQCTVEIFEPEGTGCNSDNDVCTLETCAKDGDCKSTGTVEQCAAQQQNNPCWTYTCNKSKGCIQSAFINGNSCDDGSACTTNDTCSATDNGGKICIGTPIVVDDGNPCTDDKCVDGKTVHTATDGAACKTNNLCFSAATCVGSKCEPNKDSAVDCTGAKVSCHSLACNPDTGKCEASPSPVGTGCDDGDLCTHTDECNGAGGCDGTPISCSGAPGTCGLQLTCNGTATCVEAMPGNQVACDDGDFCTIDDYCDGAGGCASGKAKTCPQPDALCTTAVCQPTSGDCVNQAVNNCCGNSVVEGDETCDDGNQSDGDGCSAQCKTESVGGCKPLVADRLYVSSPGPKEIHTKLLGLGVHSKFATAQAYDMAINHKTKHLYWTYSNGTIKKMSLKGGDEAVVLANLESPEGIDLDLENDHIYWSSGNWKNKSGVPIVLRADMDGSNIQTVVESQSTADQESGNTGLVLDVPHQKIYWMSGYYDGFVWQSDLTGDNAKVIGNTVGIAAGIDVDSVGQKIYWVEYGNSDGQDRVVRANLNGSNPQVIIAGWNQGFIQPRHVAVDGPGKRLFITDVHGDKVYRSTLEGTALAVIMTNVKEAYDVVLTGPNPCN